jgi:hypothetical protein
MRANDHRHTHRLPRQIGQQYRSLKMSIPSPVKRSMFAWQLSP